ncbi:uncharacterized protein HNQ51_001774 [Inhella inkyongensis]|uniref:Large ribosomal RNA subunit accumulation protein YceD n=1 Tax=Inhella inkyongensis TaxID=392593 RepID=A0A840S7N9_9BURK|nr:YceD family protein [Inhella inkyongensis]MBB5204460.1 uncharacterized protein [Inhella inkyongensis]
MKAELNWKPERLDVEAFAKQGARLAGEWPASELTRWVESNLPDQALVPVQWTLTGEWRKSVGAAPEVWLHLDVGAAARLCCQRCLQAFEQQIRFERAFRFVRDEATALELDPEAEEDLLVLSRSFDARELVEDELLLALPIVPMHDDCEPPPIPQGEPEPEQQAEVKPNPFAVLAALRAEPKK